MYYTNQIHYMTVTATSYQTKPTDCQLLRQNDDKMSA